VLAGSTIGLGTLPLPQALETWSRVWPVLAFLLVLAIASDLLGRTGLFDAIAHAMVLAGRGRTPVLCLLLLVLCLACTIVLSLDTTVLLLTPIAIRLCRRADLRPAPFAVICLWGAIAGSMLLPISNLTNLLAQDHLGWHPLTFAAHTWLLQCMAAVIMALVLLSLHGRDFRGHYSTAGERSVGNRSSVIGAGLAVLGFMVAVIAGVPPWIAAAGLCTVVTGLLAVRRAERPSLPAVRRLTRALVHRPPWATAGFALGLFLLSAALEPVLTGPIATAMGEGVRTSADDSVHPVLTQGLAALRTESVSAIAANTADNLPAYLVLEPATRDPLQLLAALVGVNLGATITPWGTLAALLWLRVCREGHVAISVRRLAAEGALLATALLLGGACVIASS
jgi:Na+/H+ antiporter NhaD/arsenite permease-like protein